MIDFLLQSANLPFTVALGLMIGIGLLEGVATLLGTGISGFLNAFLPEADIALDPGAGVRTGAEGLDLAEMGSPSALSKLLGWLHVGRIPVLVLLVCFLFSFGMLGLVLQAIARDTVGTLMPGSVAGMLAFVGALGFVRVSGRALAKLIPKDESEAVSENDFIGRVAHLTLGSASKGKPAQAKLRDARGRTHYVMVEPDEDTATLAPGTDVLIVKKGGAVFYAIPNTNKALIDT